MKLPELQQMYQAIFEYFYRLPAYYYDNGDILTQISKFLAPFVYQNKFKLSQVLEVVKQSGQELQYRLM